MGVTVKQIEWQGASKPNHECPYNHEIGQTPIGKYKITWKGWKERPDFLVESSFGDYSMDVFESIKSAKIYAQNDFEFRIKSCLMEG